MANICNANVVLAILVLVQITNASGGLRISWKGVKDLKVDSALSPNVNDDCLSNSICKNVANYPTKIATWAMTQLSKKKGMNESIPLNENQDMMSLACDIREEVIYPKAAMSSEEKWYFIFNLDDEHFQGFYTNICSTNNQCSNLMQPAKSSCTQHYTLRTMIYFDMENEMVAEKLFQVPTRCSCKLLCSN